MSNNQTPNDTPKDKTKVQAFFATVKERFAKLTKTQKIVSGIVGAIVVLGLIAIPLIKPLQEKLALASIGSSPVKITVNSAETIIPYDGDEDSTYIAYNVTFENTSSKSMNFTSVIELVNDEGEALSPEYVYDSTEKFETIQSEILSIGKNKKKTGYIVYKLDDIKSSKDYSIEANYYTTDYSEELTSTADLADVKVTDNRDKIADLTKDYINQVFLNSESTNITSSEAVASKGSAQVSMLDSKSSDSSSDFKLGNDISADKADFTKRFKAAIPDMFSYYQPSDAEMNTFIQQYIQANAKRSQISVKVTEFYPTSAKVTVSSKVIDIGAVDTDTLVDEYLKQLTGKTYTSDSKLMADAEKYIFTNLYTRFPTTAMTTQTSEDDLIITYDDKKWTVDSSDSESNYGYSQLQRSMAGDLFY